MGRKSEVKPKDSEESFQIGYIWKVKDKVWYSDKLINKIIKLCKKAATETNEAVSKVATDILKILNCK